MMFLGKFKLGESLDLSAQTFNATTGAATDADSLPAYNIYRGSSATPVYQGEMSLFDAANTNGQYYDSVALTILNGFKHGSYRIRTKAVVAGVTGAKEERFQIVASDVVLTDTITVDTQTSFRLATQPWTSLVGLTAGQKVVLRDVSDSMRPSVRRLVSLIYDGGDTTVVINSAPEFTLATGDIVEIFVSPGQLENIRTQTAELHDNRLTSARATKLDNLDAPITGLASLGNPNVLQSTTIATLTSQTVFTLTAGSPDDDAYNGMRAVITDQTTSTQKAVETAIDYVGATKTLTLRTAPSFTIAVGDSISIIANPDSRGPFQTWIIPASRSLTVKSRTDGTFGVVGRIRQSAGETLRWEVDLAGTQLAVGDLVDSLAAPAITGAQAANASVGSYGIVGTKARFEFTLTSGALSTDTINVKLTITPESGETVIVTVPATVGG